MSTGKLIRKLKSRDVWTILLGSLLMSIAVKYVLDPAGLVTGGVSGLSIVVKDLGRRAGISLPLWLGNVVFNVPIFLFALWTDGLRGILRTGLCWVLMSVELLILPDPWYLPDNLLLVSLYGGVLFGASTGILLGARTTSGGTDLLASSLIHFAAKRRLKGGSGSVLRQVSYGALIAVLDGAVVAIGALVFDLEHTLYAILSVYVMGKVTDLIMDRGKSARMVLVVSDQSDPIAADIMEGLDRGVTALHATGMYRGTDRRVLLVVCGRRELVEVKDIVKERDPKAFVTVGSVSEVLGEGFLENW